MTSATAWDQPQLFLQCSGKKIRRGAITPQEFSQTDPFSLQKWAVQQEIPAWWLRAKNPAPNVQTQVQKCLFNIHGMQMKSLSLQMAN